MEIIKKQIYLDPYISRHGSFIPYIVKDVEKQTPLTMGYSYIDVTTFSEYGNWGCYPYDIDIDKCQKFQSYNLSDVSPSGLKKYFTSNRVSFKELADKFSLLRKIVSDTKFYKTILKNGNIVWVEIDLNLTEKLNYEILDKFPTVYVEGYICGVYADNSFKENGGKNMFLFLMKAMGIFVVNPLYIADDNGIPETMYYASIGSYLKKMDKLKNSEKCCIMHDYEFWGGDLFYNYLASKRSEIKSEINYWFVALYRDSNEIPSPNLHMSIGLNEECLNVGNYIAVPNTDSGIRLESNNRYLVRTLEKESQLKTLRRTKISYYDVKNPENGKWETKEFPMILDERNVNEQNIAENYEITQPYIVGYPKNLHQVGVTNTYYGDMIYQMDFLKEYSYNSDGVSSQCTFDMDGNVISGKSYDNAEEFLTDKGKSDYLPEYTGKVTGSTDEEYDVWDDTDKAKNEGLNEFSHKYSYHDTPLYGEDENGERIQTGYTRTYSATLYDFKESVGYVHIYYVIGGKLKRDNGEWKYVDKTTNSNSEIDIKTFILNPYTFKGNIDDYMFIKDKLNDLVTDPKKYESDGIFYKGELTEFGSEKYPDSETEETWVYKVNFRYDETSVDNNGKKVAVNSYYVGDFMIVNSKFSRFHFNMQQIGDNNFTGVRYYEKKRWRQKDFSTDDNIKIEMLFDDVVNILQDANIVKNLENVELVDYTNMDDNVEGYFISNETLDRTYSSNLLLMNDYDFGKMEMIVENSADVIIDRGYVSTFELHYKLSEINTMEDMENYGNNFFGL